MALNLATSFRGEPRGIVRPRSPGECRRRRGSSVASSRGVSYRPIAVMAVLAVTTPGACRAAHRRGFSRRQVWWSPPAASRRAPPGASSLSSSQSIRSRAIARWIGPLRASGLQARVNSQLRKDVLHVPSHRLGRESQLRSHLIASTPDDEKLEHSLLLLGQVLRCGGNEGRPTGRC